MAAAPTGLTERVAVDPGSGRRRHVTVLGAGIVGIACASYLRRDGHAVTVIDRLPPGEECSRGHAGLLAPGSCVPLAMPGVLSQVPKWLVDPDGPLAIRWRYLPQALPWLLRFVRESTRERSYASARAQRALIRTSFEAYAPLVTAAGVGELIRRTGYLYVYESEEAYRRSAAMWEMRRACGVRIEILGREQILQLEPTLAPIFSRGVLLPDEGYCADSVRLVQALSEQFVRDGGEILRATALGFDAGSAGPKRLHTDHGDRELDALVVAAGAWSHKLSKLLGDPVPLETIRGYNVTIEKPGVTPRIPVMSGEGKFVVTPMDADRLRVAGVAEIAGLDAPPSSRRRSMFLSKVARMFPGVDTSSASDWMGHRPALPDSVPVISPSRRFASVFYAFGHGFSGFTGAAATGKLIADLVLGRHPAIDLKPYRVDRF